jgi:hypothetical protein
MRETKEECLISRLSLLELRKESEVSTASGRGAFRGAYGCGPSDFAAILARRDRRLEGAVGACIDSQLV